MKLPLGLTPFGALFLLAVIVACAVFAVVPGTLGGIICSVILYLAVCLLLCQVIGDRSQRTDKNDTEPHS